MPKVSIVVPCYNQELWIAETIDSVISQLYQDWELIIVNDGSTDRSCDVIQKYLEKDKRITLYNLENGGVSRARNFGADRAQGLFLLFLDGDDKLHPEYLKKAIVYLESHPHCRIFACRTRLFGSVSGRFVCSYETFPKQLIKNSLVISSLIYKIDFINIKGFDESFKSGLEDWEMYIRLIDYLGGDLPDKVHQSKDYLFNYRIMNQSVTINKHAALNSDSIIEEIINKNKDIYTRYLSDIVKISNQTLVYESRSLPTLLRKFILFCQSFI